VLKTHVIVADAARARVFLVQRSPEQHPNAPVSLKEVMAMVNSEAELRGKELFANARSGTNRAPDGHEYQYDDHRARHREEIERRFAKEISRWVTELVRNEDANGIVLAVEPRMLGLLRHELANKLNADSITSIPRDLSWQDPEHIRETLARHGAL